MEYWTSIEESVPTFDEKVLLKGEIRCETYEARGVYTGNSKKFRGFVIWDFWDETVDSIEASEFEPTHWRPYTSQDDDDYSD